MVYSSPICNPDKLASPLLFVLIILPVSGKPEPLIVYFAAATLLFVPCSYFVIFSLALASSSTFTFIL